MKILITGALGHIGSSLFRKLEKNEKISKIYLVDNLLSERYCSLFSVPKSKKFYFINLNLSSCKLEDIPKANIVVHLAAKTDAAQSAKFKKEFYTNNLKSTKKIVKYCKKNLSKLIFASSTSVYGPQSLEVDENCLKSELNPQSPYAHVKLQEEKIIAKNLIKEKFIILRLGTIYGYSPGIRFHTAVNKFCFQASLKQPLTVWKTAYNQRRPYLSLNDFNNLINHILSNKVPYNNTYNAVSKNMTVKEVINIIEKFIDIKKVFVNHEIMNQMSYIVKNKKIKSTNFKFRSTVVNDIKGTLSKLKNLA